MYDLPMTSLYVYAMIEIVTQNQNPVNESGMAIQGKEGIAMDIIVNADKKNTKNILSLLEEMGYSLPCNCNGKHHCNGKQYSFDCSLVPTSPVKVSLPDNRKILFGISLEDMTPTPGPADTVLIDIGTTTVALALTETKTGKLRRTHVFENPQRAYGSDVIARIQASCRGDGKKLRDTITAAISEHTAALCELNNQSIKDLSYCFIGGNTTMIHLLMGYDCTPLSGSPFHIAQSSPEPFSYGGCTVTILPWLSAFVGGDVTAGLFSCGMTAMSGDGDTPATALLIDLGTNGEIVLRHRNRLYTAATAAGPAFEGGGLSCGCPGIPGAISGVKLKRLRPALSTIDNKLPIGLCGSGAVSLCAELLRGHYVTEDGILTERFPSDGIFLASSAHGTPLRFTPEDFRSVQLAVSAIAAGIDTLAHFAEINVSEIPVTYLGGGFGFYLSLEDCHTLGMFSSLPENGIQPMGNTCLRGLWKYSLSPDTSIRNLPIQNINLADSAYFQEQFIRHMTYSG